MDQAEKTRLLAAVEAATVERNQVQEDARRMVNAARMKRAEAIREADDAGVPREEIAAAAGAKWPMGRAGWSSLRIGRVGK